jgi:HlyD family secretion protein
MKKLVVIIIVLALVVTGGVMAYQNGLLSEYIPILMNRFRPQTEEGVIALSGNVEITEVNIGFTLSGRIQELFAQEGQTVSAGQVLARLENAELQSVVEQNTAVLNEALLRLDDLKTGARAQEIEEAKANVEAIEAELSRAKKDYDRAKTMHEQNLIPDSQLDAAKSAYNAAIARRTQAVERLSLVQAGPTDDNVKATEFTVEQARAALRGAEERLKNTEISTPIQGIVLRKNAEVGEIIGAGTPVYTIGDLEHPWIRVYIKEDKLGLVKLGQKAQVSIDSYPDKVYEGSVTYISSEAEFTPKTVQTKEERVKLVFGVKVSVRNPHGDLKPGMPADVKILLE